MALSVNCVMTGNTSFEHGLMAVTPLTDDEISNHSWTIGCSE